MLSGNIWHDVMRQSMHKDKTTDRVFRFHGKQCGSCDKPDDTHCRFVESLRYDLQSFQFSTVTLTKEKVQKDNFNIEN